MSLFAQDDGGFDRGMFLFPFPCAKRESGFEDIIIFNDIVDI
jgi:hypothetical protein